MTAPFDARTAYLLWRATAECAARGHYLRFWPPDPEDETDHEWQVDALEMDRENLVAIGIGLTPADALTALLADLGVPDPWPDEAAVDEQTWEAIILHPAGMAQVAPVETLAVLFPGPGPKETT